MKEYPETHQTGHLTIEPEKIQRIYKNVDVGIQIAEDGRIWLCVEGQAFARFTPTLRGGKDENRKGNH